MVFIITFILILIKTNVNSKIKNYKKSTIIVGFSNPIQIKFILLAKIIRAIYKLLLKILKNLVFEENL